MADDQLPVGEDESSEVALQIPRRETGLVMHEVSEHPLMSQRPRDTRPDQFREETALLYLFFERGGHGCLRGQRNHPAILPLN